MTKSKGIVDKTGIVMQQGRMAGCAGCKYLGRLTYGYPYCDYLGIEGKRRNAKVHKAGGCARYVPGEEPGRWARSGL